jgi:hypothetical protein
MVVSMAAPAGAKSGDRTTSRQGLTDVDHRPATELRAPAAAGWLYFSQDSNANGLHLLDLSTGAGTLVGASGVTNLTVGLAPGAIPHTLLGSKWAGLLRIRIDGGGATQIGPAGAEGLAHNTVTGRLYGAINAGFFEADPDTGVPVAELPSPGFDVEGIAADPVHNRVFGIGDGTELRVYQVDTRTWSTVADTGLTWNDAGLAYDPAADLLYAVSQSTGANLYQINPNTGTPKLIGPTGVSGLSSGGLAFISGAPVYVAAGWNLDFVYLLDGNMNRVGAMPAGASDPNGVVTDGTLVFTGHPESQEVVARDLNGNERFRWSAPLGALQGMELVGQELAVMRADLGGNIDYYSLRGQFLRRVPIQPPTGQLGNTVEGLAYDGTLLWHLGYSIYGSDPATGVLERSIANPAQGCAFGGTGLAIGAPGELTVACTNGNWYKVDSITGVVFASGNNGLDMYGLGALLPAYLAATWSGDAVRWLDRSMALRGSYPAGASEPNGITSNGTLAFTGHFHSQEVVARDLFGVEWFRWSGALTGLQGLELVHRALAVARSLEVPVIQFHEPGTGALIRSIPSVTEVEGLAFDGRLLWQLASSLHGTNPANGAVVRTIPNAAGDCSFDGTGITAAGNGQLLLACTNGDWFWVSSADGSVIAAGNNGLDMFGLTAVPRPSWPRAFLPVFMR